jgi:hypothetical protein
MATEPVTGNDNLNKEIIQWGCNYLSSHGYTLKSNQPENVKNTPWSYVIRFATSDGYIYLGFYAQPPPKFPVCKIWAWFRKALFWVAKCATKPT